MIINPYQFSSISTANIQGFWNMEEDNVAPSTLLDQTANNHDLAVTGDPVGKFTPAKLGLWAWDFDGTADRATSAASTLIDPFKSSGDWGFGGWARGQSRAADKAAFGIGDNNTNAVCALYPFYSGGTINIWLNGSTVISHALSLSFNTWHHLFVNRHDSVLDLWVNKVKVASVSTTEVLSSISDSVAIGAYDVQGAEEYIGQLDHWRLYSESQIDDAIIAMANEHEH